MWLALAVSLLLLATLLWVRARASRTDRALVAERRGASELMTLVDSVPAAALWWTGRATERATDSLRPLFGLEADAAPLFAAVKGRLQATDAERLDDKIRRLRREGQGFELLLRHSGGTAVVQASGQRRLGEGPPVDIVWFRDVSDWVAEAAQLRHRAAELEETLDTLPSPVWRRAADLSLAYCNLAYARMVDSDPTTAVEQGTEIARNTVAEGGRGLAHRAIATGKSQSESHHLVAEASAGFST